MAMPWFSCRHGLVLGLGLRVAVVTYILVVSESSRLANRHTRPAIILDAEPQDARATINDEQTTIRVKENAARTSEILRDETVLPARSGDGRGVGHSEIIRRAAALGMSRRRREEQTTHEGGTGKDSH
jgi:hypothetical protein